MDYSIRSILEARVCAKLHKSSESLLREWDRMSAEGMRRVAENFTRGLKLRNRAKGGHFEKL
jgi:hypothetical protein